MPETKAKIKLISTHSLDRGYSIQNLLYADTQFLFYLKVPKSQHRPASRKLIRINFPVPLHVPFDLGDPEGSVSLYVFFADLPVMTVPERTINKDQQFVFNKGYVGFTWKLTPIAPVSETRMPNCPLEELLRFRAVCFYFGHVDRTRFGRIKAVFLTELGNNNFRFWINFHALGSCLSAPLKTKNNLR